MRIPTVNSATATTMRRAPTTALMEPGIAAVLLSVAAHDKIFGKKVSIAGIKNIH